MTEEEKRAAFLKAREEMTTIPYTPPKDESQPKPKPRTPVTPPKTSIEPAKPPTTNKPPTPKPQTTTPAPAPTPAPTPVPAPTPEPRANIVVRDSGVSKVDEEEAKPPKEESVWSRLFGSGGGGNFKYLSPSVRRAIDRAPVTKGRWHYIVVHNSGTRQGNAAAFEHYHRYVRKMPNGLAYHFVIGNGSSSKDGEIEIGGRWIRQIQGGHVHSDYLNNISLGICLVGDFNRDVPTKAQLEAVDELIKYLRKRVGRIGGQPAVVYAHKFINPPQWPTDCPGGRFPYQWLKKNY